MTRLHPFHGRVLLHPEQRAPHSWLVVLGILLCLPVAAVSGCSDDASPGDSASPLDSRTQDSRATFLDLTALAGDPCVMGKCGANLTCLANVCHTMCQGECGDTAPECQTGWACIYSSGFSGACVPPEIKYGERCDDNPNCEAKTLCVTLYDKTKKCLRLCKYGCPAGIKCWGTATGCEVCVEP